MAAYTRGLPLAEIHVASAMSAELWTCSATTSCVDVEAIMALHQVRRIPVIDKARRPVGVVSLNDLARAARSSPSAAINQRAVESTLAAISRPRAAESRATAHRSPTTVSLVT
jgi:CBS-domain-containing membrane protein